MSWNHRSLPVVLLVLLAVAGGSPVAASTKPMTHAAALVCARAVRDRVSAGTTETLWPEFTPHMQAVLKDSVSFATMSVSIRQQLGSIDSVLDEEIATTDSIVTYKSRCRFTRIPLTILLTIGVEPDGKISGLLVRPDPSAPKEYPSAFLDYVPHGRYTLPFAGEWLVGWGGRTLGENQHAATRSQRFAYDLVQVKDGQTHSGDGKTLTDYYCYGKPVLAPADGIVVTAIDSLPDQIVGARDPAHAAGNNVVVDHGSHEYSLLAHLQPHSVRVKPGQRVKRGDVLGLAGNSGNTSQPHLHVHLMNGPNMDDADGLPLPFDSFAVGDSTVAHGELHRFEIVKSLTASKH